MAYGAKYITLDDLNDKSYVGIGFPFNKPGVFTQTQTTKEATKSNLINWFLTNPGERYMNLEFGGGIRAILFEQMSSGTVNDIQSTIKQQMAQYFPDVVTTDIKAQPDYDRNTLRLQISYYLNNTGDKDRVFLELE